MTKWGARRAECQQRDSISLQRDFSSTLEHVVFSRTTRGARETPSSHTIAFPNSRSVLENASLWRYVSQGIENIHRDVIKSFPNLTVGMDVLKQVLTQMLLYYTRFLDLVKEAFPNGAPFAQYILSISTLMNEIKNFSRNF